jgi:hypothetical protein
MGFLGMMLGCKNKPIVKQPFNIGFSVNFGNKPIDDF